MQPDAPAAPSFAADGPASGAPSSWPEAVRADPDRAHAVVTGGLADVCGKAEPEGSREVGADVLLGAIPAHNLDLRASDCVTTKAASTIEPCPFRVKKHRRHLAGEGAADVDPTGPALVGKLSSAWFSTT
jgi:hypothetical protein